jgi:hypothetical protein
LVRTSLKELCCLNNNRGVGQLRIADLKGEYDAIFSLGELCFISIQLEKNGIRPYSGVLDWVGSPNLNGVNRLLRNRFEGFMDRHQIACIGTAGDKLYLVQDKTYDIYSNHDFFIAQNDPKLLEAYPSVKAKYDRRVARFLEKVDTSEMLLFVPAAGLTKKSNNYSKYSTISCEMIMFCYLSTLVARMGSRIMTGLWNEFVR